MPIRRRSERKIAYSSLPLRQRVKLSLVNNWFYFLIGTNMILFIWLIIPATRPSYYYSSGIEANSQVDLSKDCFLPYWRDTSLMLKRQCLSVEFSDEAFNLEDEVVRLKSCQSQQSINLWHSPNNYFFFLPINILPAINKKIISFSLYGTSPRYYRNVIRIIRRYKEFLPGWTPRFWLGSDVPFLMINRLLHEDVEIVIVYQRQPELNNVSRLPGFHGMFWRFFVADDESVERYIVRDIDSMPIIREIEAIKQWIQEQTIFHVMRDHPQHATEILGGMWGGIVDKVIFSPSEKYGVALNLGYRGLDGKGLDQDFLKKFLWPIARHQMTCHTSHSWPFVDGKGCKPFPIKRQDDAYIGAVLDY